MTPPPPNWETDEAPSPKSANIFLYLFKSCYPLRAADKNSKKQYEEGLNHRG